MKQIKESLFFFLHQKGYTAMEKINKVGKETDTKTEIEKEQINLNRAP